MVKIIKKVSILLLLICLVVMQLSPAALAKENYNKKESEVLVSSIANGSDFVFGNGKSIEGGEVDPSTIHPSFTSGGIDHTHQYLSAQGMEILKSDKGATFLYTYASTILTYSDKPDVDETFMFNLYHFYNPYTGKNYLGNTTTARTKFVQHAKNAKAYFRKNKTYAMQELGRALHYLADLNEPHHAANLTALNSNHTQYETWVDINRTKYVSSSANGLYSFSGTFDAYCNNLAYNYAVKAYSYKNDATATLLYGSPDYARWDSSASGVMTNAQTSIAAFLYRYLYEIGKM